MNNKQEQTKDFRYNFMLTINQRDKIEKIRSREYIKTGKYPTGGKVLRSLIDKA